MMVNYSKIELPRKLGVVQLEGSRNVNREPTFYNLDAIISVGYSVSSIRATQFRQWCTYILRQYAIRCYVLDRKRMENGSFIGEDYFVHLMAEILALIEELDLEVVGVIRKI